VQPAAQSAAQTACGDAEKVPPFYNARYEYEKK
jgi:hypothetical protein